MLAGLADRLLNALTAALLGSLLVLLFANVVLRYGFNSGLTLTEELSRVLFVWLVFIGAVAAMRRDEHPTVGMVVKALPPGPRRAVRIVARLMMAGCCAILALGCWRLTLSNMSNPLPISGIETGWIYFAGVVGAVGMLAIIVADLARSPLEDARKRSAAPGDEPSDGSGR